MEGCFWHEKERISYRNRCSWSDEYIQNLNVEISDLYSSYYKIDYNDAPVYFDKDQEKKDKYKMLALLEKLKKRLYEINDGSFEIDDRETERVKNL